MESHFRATWQFRGRPRFLIGFALVGAALMATGAVHAQIPAVPGSPTPGSTSSPGPTTSSSTVALDWSNSSGATYYDLGVRDMATNQLVVDTQVSNSAFTANLSPGKPYRWNVAACNSSGCSSFTTARYFQTPAAVPAVPGSPTPGSTSSPGPTTSSSTVALDWSNSSGATYYELGVRDMATNQLVVDTQVSNSAYTANLDPGKPYRWNVAACNASGCSDFTAHRYFQTPATVPATPASPTPGSTSSPGPTTSSATVDLDWSNSSGATFYDLGVRDLSTNQLVVDTQVSSSAYTANLQPGRPYRWDVAACNSAGCSSPTADRYFQTPAATPATPANPAPGSTSSPGPTLASPVVQLSWSASSGALDYDVGVRDLVTNQLVVDTRTANTTLSVTLEPGKPYKWDVAACISSNCSSPTADRFFQTPVATPATPANPAPGSTSSPGPTLASPVVQLSWSASSGALDYDVGVRDLVTNQLVIDTRTANTSLSVTLQPGKPYKWDVAACISANCSSPTTDRYFTIAAATGAPEIAISPLTLTFAGDAFAVRESFAESRAAREIDWAEVARLEEKAREAGSVRVTIGLDAAFVPEGFLVDDLSRSRQRTAIEQAKDELLQELGLTQQSVAARFVSIPFLSLELDTAALARVAASDRVFHIHENFAVPPALASSAPVVGAPAAWAEGFDGSGQVVAVLDTGVDKTHPFFAGGKVVAEACFSTNNGSIASLCPGGAASSTAAGSAAPCPASISLCDHGTHVAGIAAGSGGSGSNIGIARGADVIAVQVFSRQNDPAICGGSAPCLGAEDDDLVEALLHVLSLRDTFSIAAANLSLGGGQYSNPTTCDQRTPDFKDAVDQLRSYGIATVISTGNEGYVASTGWPGCVSSVVSVGATEDDDDLYVLGNVAPFVDLLAPGFQIRSSVPGTGTMSYDGTSMAAPHVAGAWAILKQRDPDASVTEILGLLRETATVVEDDRPNGVETDLRRIDIAAALAFAGEGQDFVISNSGTAVLTVSEIRLDQAASWISWSPQAPFDVPAGESVAVMVSVDFAVAPTGSSTRRLLVSSNDANESPYPNGVFIEVEQASAPRCYGLTRTHTGSGGHPAASPVNSSGCPSGQYTEGAQIQLTASPSSGWTVGGWSGTSNNGSTSLANQLTMPDNDHTVGVIYLQDAPPEAIFQDGFESGNLSNWTVVGPVGGNLVLFSDDFNDDILDPKRWTWYGNSVRETGGQFQVSCEVTDQGGGANTQFFRIARTGIVTLTRRARVFAGNQYFDGLLRFEPGELEADSFGISYGNYDGFSPGECPAHGFAIFRRGVNAHWCESQAAHVSSWIPAIWGTFFDEKFEWDPATGAAAYSINGQLRLTMNVGALPAGVDRLRVRISTWGWWTGHYQHSDDFRITQAAQ